MTTIIQSGRTGNTADVDSKNRLATRAVSESSATAASIDGDSFIASTSIITLTSDSASALFYISNTDIESWEIDRFLVNTGASDGSGEVILELIVNPSAGTLVSAGTDIIPGNLNLGSPKQLTSVVKQGAEASTITDGIVAIPSIIPSAAYRFEIKGQPVIVEPTTSFALRVTPPSGNSSMTAQIAVALHRLVED